MMWTEQQKHLLFFCPSFGVIVWDHASERLSRGSEAALTGVSGMVDWTTPELDESGRASDKDTEGTRSTHDHSTRTD